VRSDPESRFSDARSTQPFSSTKPAFKMFDNFAESPCRFFFNSLKNRRMFWFVFIALMVPYVGVPREADDSGPLAKV
jgi:hypothetical protein